MVVGRVLGWLLQRDRLAVPGLGWGFFLQASRRTVKLVCSMPHYNMHRLSMRKVTHSMRARESDIRQYAYA